MPCTPLAQTREPIRVGAAVSLSGRYSDSAVSIRDGYTLLVDEVNAAGGIGGRPVKLIVYDDASSPDTGRVLAERLINRDQVSLILGPYSSPITDAIAVVCERAQVPMLASIASDAGIWERRPLKWTFQAFLPSTYDQESFMAVAKAKGAKRMALIFEETPFAVAAKNWAVAQAPRMGMQIDTYAVTLGNQDFRSVIERIVASGADVISQNGYLQSAVALTRQCIERGVNVDGFHFITASEGASQAALGENILGIFGRSAWEPSLKNEANARFVRAFQTRYSRTPSYHAATAYAAGQVARAALVTTTDKAALRAFFATQQVDTVMGRYQVNDQGIQVGYRYIGMQWQPDGCVVVWPDAGRQAEPIWPKPRWK